MSQKKPLLSTHDEIQSAITKELDDSFAGGKLKKTVDKYGITGTYNYDLTVGDKGELVTVFTIREEGMNNDYVRWLQYALKAFKYKSFKIPKYKSEKVQYSIAL